MSIRNRIIYGYGLTLGLALVGASSGLFIGNYYQQQAIAAQTAAARERRLLSNLTISILYNRPAKQLTPYVNNPPIFQRESQALMERVAAIQTLLKEQETPSELPGLQSKLDAYEQTVQNFADHLKQFIPQAQAMTTSPTGAAKAQKLVVELVKSPEFVAFIEFPDQLKVYNQQSEKQEMFAEQQLQQAEQLRSQIILGSLGISFLVAIVTAWYISNMLAASEAKFRTFVETANDLIFSLDPAGAFTYLSPNTPEILGFTPEEMIGSNFAAIVHPDDLAKYQQIVQEVMDGRKIRHLEYRVRHKDGRWRYHSTSASPELNDQGNIVSFLGFSYDFTDRKLAELQQQKLNQQLLKANQLKDEFLAMMSHELRTPLNAVLGMAESLEEEIFGPINDLQKQSLELIYQSASHLLDLINDILDLSKMEAGQTELSRQTANFQELIDSSLVYVKTQAIKKHITLTKAIAPDLPPIVVDERRIRQVLINLLNNAVKFTPEGGTVTVSVALLPSFTDIDHPHVRLAVRDTGIGISPENLPKLFQPFIQVDSALNRKHEGTGLGLSLVKNIVEMHGGEVGVDSEEGRGSCFWFTIPCSN
ncbi:PAS domain-containing sensor histidine kinase [Synechocystis salina LEGE 06155]|nr:PAS domain-containing sensor histidine kinase [Synechocystis salina LEGE 06155]